LEAIVVADGAVIWIAAKYLELIREVDVLAIVVPVASRGALVRQEELHVWTY